MKFNVAATGLHLNLTELIVQGDLCVIRWVSSISKAPQGISDVVGEVVELATHIGTSFIQARLSLNSSIKI